jgi:Protein of unknown function (DUF2905)
MSEMTTQLGKVLVIFGVVLLGTGLILIFGSRFSFFGLGKLPGDIAYKGKNFSFYFPIVTCVLLSALATLVFWLFSYFSRK